MTGLEPVTSALPRRCTTDCATLAYSVFELNFVVFLSGKICHFLSYQGCALPAAPHKQEPNEGRFLRVVCF